MSSTGSLVSSGSSEPVIRYSSEFMRTLRHSDGAKDVPPDILRRYQQAEYYNSKQQFDPDQIGSSSLNRLARDMPIKAESGGRDNSVTNKEETQPQLRPSRSWKGGCGASIQSDSESSGAANSSAAPSLQPKPNVTHVTSSNTNSNVRQPGAFPPGNRPIPSGLGIQPSGIRGPGRGGGDFGQGYASTYRPPRDSQDFRQNRPAFGRGRGAFGGRAQEEYDGSNRFPPPLFQQRQGFGGFGSSNRGGFSSRRHTQSTGDSVPEWFTEGPSDPSMMMELGGELPSSSRSSSPADSFGEESGDESRVDGMNINLKAGDRGTSNNTANRGEEILTSDGTKLANWENTVDKDRPASQQMDYTYLLWSSLQSDLTSSLSDNSKGVIQDNSEITGSKLWSVWKDAMPANNGPSGASEQYFQQQQTTGSGSGVNLRDWLENAQMAERMASGNLANINQRSLQTIATDPAALRVITTAEGHASTTSGSTASPVPRGLNPNELFAKFSISNGAPTATPQAPQLTQAVSVNSQVRKSPPVGQTMSVEDLERKLMMKKQGSAKSHESERDANQTQKHPPVHSQQQRSFYDASYPSQQSHHASVKPPDESNLAQQQQPFTGISAATLQVQLAAAQQALLNAVTAAHNAGNPGAANAALQQQKMLFANLVQQHQQQLAANSTGPATSNGSSNASSNGNAPPNLPPFLNMIPPNALAAAAAAAASSPLFYYPQLLQQAQANAARGSNAGSSIQQAAGNPPVSTATGSARPPFPVPPPGSFPNYPPLNPAAAANLMAAAFSHFQQQQQQNVGGKSASPGPTSTPGSSTQSTAPFNNTNVAAAAAAAATALMASRMGMNPHLPGFASVPQFPLASGLLPQAPVTNPSNSTNSASHPPLQQTTSSQSQTQMHQHQPTQPNSPPRARASSPGVAANTTSSAKLGASFIPTQVMMKNPHTINSSPDTPGSTGKATTQQASRLGKVPFNKTQPAVADNQNAPMSYSSVAAGPTSGAANQGGSSNTSQVAQPAKMWTAEDLERPFIKSAQHRDGASVANNYSSYPPLHQQAGVSQRTAGIAAVSSTSSSATNRFQDSSSSSSSHRVIETAHQFSVADLLRGAANANKAAQSSSAGFT